MIAFATYVTKRAENMYFFVLPLRTQVKCLCQYVTAGDVIT